jgi:hypothetical protein
MRFASSLWLLAVAVIIGTPSNSAFELRTFASLAVPGAPTLAHTVIGTTVTMTWSPAPGGDQPTGYSVEASLTPGGAAIVVFPTAATSLTVADVPPGTYFVRVKGVNADGAGQPSNEETVVVGGACQAPPGAPTGLVASLPGPSVTLSWLPPVGGCAPTGFELRAGFAPGQATFRLPMGTNTSFSGTAAPGTYFVSVVAVNANGAGPPSDEITVEIVCATPGAPLALTSTVTGNAVMMSWAPPGSGGAATNYRLEAGTSPNTTVASFAVPGTAFSTVAPNGTFFVRVRAVNSCGMSPPSNERTVIVPSCGPTPGAPATPVATISAGVATVTWGSVNGAARYRLDVGTSPGASNTSSQTVTGTSHQLVGLPAGNYFMRVTALDACGSAGLPSGEGSFTIVTPVTLLSINVTGPSSLLAGQNGQFTATGLFSNGTSANVTGTAAWASSNTAVAAPVVSGLFTAMGPGNATISAALQNLTGSLVVQVVQPSASFVVITDPLTIPPASSGQCLVERRAENEPNHLRCRFDGSPSVPDNATYAWEIPLGVPNGTTESVQGTSLSFACGTLGLDAQADDFDVKLTITVSGISVSQTRRITFVKFGAC